MRYEDRVSIVTPEGVELDVPLAGLGSRFIAATIDSFIQMVVIVALIIVFRGALWARANEGSSGFVFGALAVLVFLLIFGYDVAFETLAGGRTPGKRLAGLRVVTLEGHPVGFRVSAVRNLLRLVDFLPVSYAAGVTSILVSPRNQRVGDIAAGTLVVREQRKPTRAPTYAPHAPPAGTFSSWDVSSVTNDELVAVRRFLERRHDVTPEARGRLAWELAERLRPKVAGAPPDLHPETFLERLAAAKSARA